MIKKFARIDAPMNLVRSLFTDVASWPLWMPGVKSVKVLKQAENYILVELKQVRKGWEFIQEMEYRLDAAGVKQKQTRGWFKHWEADWRFMQPPDKRGTTVSVSLRFEMGMLGFFTPSRLIQETMDQMFDEIMDKAERRARALMAKPITVGLETSSEEETVLEIFQTPAGLEIWIEGKKVALQAPD